MSDLDRNYQQKFYTKTDLLMIYGVGIKIFEEHIKDIMPDIGWIKGQRQKFPPKVYLRIRQHLESPAIEQ